MITNCPSQTLRAHQNCLLLAGQGDLHPPGGHVEWRSLDCAGRVLGPAPWCLRLQSTARMPRIVPGILLSFAPSKHEDDLEVELANQSIFLTPMLL